MDHAELRRQGLRDHQAKLRHHTDGDVAQDKAMIKEAFAEHDKQLHGGKKTRLKFKRGGHVEGEETRKRLDRPTKKSPRMARADGGDVEAAPMEYARGGRTKKAGHKTQVNVIIAGGHGADAPPAGPPMMAGPPPGGPPPGVGGPPGMPGGMPPHPPMGPPVGAGVPMPHKRGGRVKKAYGGGMGGFGPLAGPGTGFPVQPMPPAAGGVFQSQQQVQPGRPGMPPQYHGAPPLAGVTGMPPQIAHMGQGQMGAMPSAGVTQNTPSVGQSMPPVMGGAPAMPGVSGQILQGGGLVPNQQDGLLGLQAHPGMGGPPGRPMPQPMPPPQVRMGGQPIGAKRGGRIPDGAGSGPGRLEKTAAYGIEKVGGRENEGFTGDGENKDETEKFRRGGRAHHG